MRIIETENLGPNSRLNPDDNSWCYNGLDACLTLEIRDKLRADLEDEPANVKETYATALRKMPPVLYMNSTGLRVNSFYLNDAVGKYEAMLSKLNTQFDHLCRETLGYTINWRSHVQLKQLFYGEFNLPPKRKRNSKGEFAPTINEDALNDIEKAYIYPRIYAKYVLAMRDIGKKVSFLKGDTDNDGRRRTSLNIAGTDTGRFASAMSAFGSGGNLQNVENLLRQPFVPDDGHIFVNVDLEQADARNVAARIWNVFYYSHGPEMAGAYLDACESGDLHTAVTKMVWPDLSWTEDASHNKKVVAGEKFYREHSYRDMAKRLGHGTSYFGTPKTMALHTKTEIAVISQFQQRFFRAFPLIGSYAKANTRNNGEILKLLETEESWHGWVYRQLRDVGYLNNLFGRRRIFFDRYRDLNTFRAAVAYDPQSSTGEELDRGWINLYENMPEARLSLPVHDSILFQLPIEGLAELLPQALQLLTVTIELVEGRLFTVPLEAKVGFNWADREVNKDTGLIKNEYGLMPWTGKEERDPPRLKTRFRDLRP